MGVLGCGPVGATTVVGRAKNSLRVEHRVPACSEAVAVRAGAVTGPGRQPR